MVKVEAIQENNRRRSSFIPMAQGAVTGALVGYVGKYALPLTSEEKRSDEYIKVTNKIEKEKFEFNIKVKKFVDKLAAKTDKTYAEDQYIKMFDGMKDGDRVGIGRVMKAVRAIKENKPEELFQFKKMCAKSNAIAEKTAKQCLQAYDLVTKHIRPTGFFLAAGAITGACIALAHDILKTDVKAP